MHYVDYSISVQTNIN